MDSRAVLDLRGVSLWVAGPPRVELLQNVSWAVGAGEHWAVLGANGAGKTSLLSLASAMRHPSAGTAFVLGEQLGRTDMRELRARIGVVDAPTAARLPARLTLREVALTGATGTVLPRPEVLTDDDALRAQAELDLVGLGALSERRFGECSQGERQRALLARALVGRPELLLLDEAAVGLDLPAREALLAALTQVARERRLTSVTVTHHLEELPPTTSHALLLGGGVVEAAGEVGEVLTDARLSAVFGLPVRVSARDGRWAAQADAGWARAV